MKSHRPGIDEHHPAALEVAGVASREGRLAQADDTGDLDVADLDDTAGAPALGGDAADGLSRGLVEGERTRFSKSSSSVFARFEVGGTGLLAAQLWKLLREANAREAGGDPRTERRRDGAFLVDRIAEDLADLLLRAVAMASGEP